MEYFLIIFAILAGLFVYGVFLKRNLHIMQLEGYKNRQFIHWLRMNVHKAVFQPFWFLIITIVLYVLCYGINLFREYASGIAVLSFFTSGFILVYPIINKKQKKPVVFTDRLIRLLVTNILVIIAETLFFIYILLSSVSQPSRFVIWLSIAVVLVPLNVVLSNLIIYPLEMIINRYYINSAAKKISSMKNLMRIGITGSYGKTSTKFILSVILSEKYKVLFTPDSYNTTMGTTKVILQNLDNSYEIFISEMGARNIGDIAEICSIVKPGIGIITSIGKQHLETFKTLDNIVKTKYELIQGLTPGGTSFFPLDNQYCYDLYKSTSGDKISYGIDENLENIDMTVEDIILTSQGSTFILVCGDGAKVKCKTVLLGEHNILNILGGASIAKHLGLTMEEIAAGISKIEPIPHRLQLLPTQNGTIVIDDAFNSNPAGAKMALDVLSKFEGRKIIITPGMVELGIEEYTLNMEFGKYIAGVADIAILIGKKRTEAIQQGLNEASFNKENLFIVNNLDEATMQLSAIVKNGDVILFENDLPDNYDE